MGSRTPCAICGGAGRGARAEFHLPGGVSVWLCAAHRDPSFLVRRAGRDLVAGLSAAWDAAGCMTSRRSRSLDLHLERLAPVRQERPCAGSYAWSALRAEAEACFASGEAPAAVIDRLRSREARGSARPPSVTTMRRWFRDGRWLPPDDEDASASSP